MAENVQSPYVIGVNDITFPKYDAAKEIWNSYHNIPADTLYFFDFCVRNMLPLKPLYDKSWEIGQPNLWTPYIYYRDMVIIGAQVGLERIRGRWPSTSPTGRSTVRYLRHWRITANTVAEDLVVDTEAEYYSENADIMDLASEPESEPEG